MTNSFAPSSPRYILNPFYTRHIALERSDIKMVFFRHTNREKINFVRDLSLSQQHTLMRFGNRCFLPCLTTDINRHLNGLIGETMNSCDTKSICFNPFKRCYNTSREGKGMEVPNCLYRRHDSAHLGDGKCTFHFTPLAQRTVNDLVLVIDYLW